MYKSIQTEYKMPLKIASYDVGANDVMRLSAVLRYQQEAGEEHLTPAGLGWCELEKEGIAFVASRWHTAIHRLPRMGEAVTLTTWHRERKGPRFLRCYEWHDSEGNLLLEGVMQFALVSVTDHRLLRGDEFMRLVPPEETVRGVSCADPVRFSLPPMTPAGDYRVRWSDIDRNGHMNNTHYADLLWDFLPAEVQSRQPVDIQLHFAGECRQGDTIAMEVGQADTAWVVRGETDRGGAFAARVELTDGV
jgi:acyl-ACP thioesterase